VSTEQDIMMGINISARSREELTQAAARGTELDLLYLSGTIDLLAEETLITMGANADALFLFPCVEELSRAICEFRVAGTSSEVVLVPDSTIWLVRPPQKLSQVTVLYRRQRSPQLSMGALESAACNATVDFVQAVMDAYPAHLWSLEAIKIVREIATRWEVIDRFLARFPDRSGPRL
jgi:hypothetical protein